MNAVKKDISKSVFNNPLRNLPELIEAVKQEVENLKDEECIVKKNNKERHLLKDKEGYYIL